MKKKENRIKDSKDLVSMDAIMKKLEKIDRQNKSLTKKVNEIWKKIEWVKENTRQIVGHSW